MSRKSNRHTRYSGSSGNNNQNKPQIVIHPSQEENEQIFIQHGNLALVREARPRKTPAPTSTANLRNKAQSLSLDWDDNEALQIQNQRPLTEAERKETLYSVYVGNTWVSSCVDVISKRFTSGGWHMEEVEQDKGDLKNKDTLKNFLLNINDDEDFLQFLRGAADDLDIYGESYAEIIPGPDGLPVQLVSIDCVTMTYELDEHGNITKYVQTLVKSNRTVEFKPEQIIRWWLPSKRARKVAFSPIEKMVNPTYADKNMVDWVHMFFKKGTRPSTWIKLGDDSDIDDARQYLKFYKENYTGAQNAHTPQIAYGGATINEYGKGSIDVDFGKGRLFTREEVLAGYGVPPATIGIIESGNIGSGTGEDQDKALRNNTVDPIKQLILEKFNRRVVVGGFGITDWVVTTRYADYRSDVEISEVQNKRIFSGVSTPNQERIDAGKAPYPDTGDTPIVVAGKEILPLERIDDLAQEQRDTSDVTLQTQKAALDLAQTQADKAKHPDPVSPALSNGQPGQQKAQGGQPDANQKQVKQQMQPPQDENEHFIREDKNTGIMVAFMLDAQTAKKLALPGGESPKDMHITLAYLGDKVDFTGDVAKLKKELTSFASEAIPLKGTTGGLGRFTPSDSSDNTSPIVALVNIPGIQKWRTQLVKRLEIAGATVASDFEFTPHITLDYIDADAQSPIKDVPNVPLDFDTLWLCIGDERYSFKVGDEQYPDEQYPNESFFVRASDNGGNLHLNSLNVNKN
jgi:HK97 family phage portal protein